jgi:sugar/nucleoside kinase (ribokinase family)
MGAKRVVITRGGKGAVAIGDDIAVEIGTYAVNFVDGSGGGDAFDAGYITGIVAGETVTQCITRAAAQGASCVRGIGTTATIFNKTESDAFIAANQLSVKPLSR